MKKPWMIIEYNFNVTGTYIYMYKFISFSIAIRKFYSDIPLTYENWNNHEITIVYIVFYIDLCSY